MSDKSHTWLTTGAAADLLPISRSKLQNLRKENKGPPYWEGPKGQIKYREDHVLQWSDSYMKGAQQADK